MTKKQLNKVNKLIETNFVVVLITFVSLLLSDFLPVFTFWIALVSMWTNFGLTIAIYLKTRD